MPGVQGQLSEGIGYSLGGLLGSPEEECTRPEVARDDKFIRSFGNQMG